MIYVNILPILSCLGSFAVSIFVITRNPKRLINISISVGLLSLAIMEFANAMLLQSASKEGMLFWSRIEILGELIFIPSLLLFSHIFGRKYKEFNIRDFSIPTVCIIISLTFMIISFMAFSHLITCIRYGEPSRYILKIGHIGYYMYLFISLFAILCLSKFEGTLRSSPKIQKWQIKYALLGLGGIVASIIFISGQRLLYRIIDLELIEGIV